MASLRASCMPVHGYLEEAEEYLHQYDRKEGGGGGKHQGEEEDKYSTN
jgi:hypothetical protein